MHVFSTRDARFAQEDTSSCFFHLGLSARTVAQNRPVGTVKVRHRTEMPIVDADSVFTPAKDRRYRGFFQDWRHDLAWAFLRAPRQFAVNLADCSSGASSHLK
jgi:hypothetical protein